MIDTLELYAQNGVQLAKRRVAVLANAADELNGANRAFDLSIPPDDDGVLTSTAATQVFLMARSG